MGTTKDYSSSTSSLPQLPHQTQHRNPKSCRLLPSLKFDFRTLKKVSSPLALLSPLRKTLPPRHPHPQLQPPQEKLLKTSFKEKSSASNITAFAPPDESKDKNQQSETLFDSCFLEENSRPEPPQRPGRKRRREDITHRGKALQEWVKRGLSTVDEPYIRLALVLTRDGV